MRRARREGLPEEGGDGDGKGPIGQGSSEGGSGGGVRDAALTLDGPAERARRTADSLVEMTEIVLPEDSNAHGSIFGGRVLALVDKCASVVALRHTRGLVVTASLDSVDFPSGARVGHVLVLKGRLNAVFGSSMEIEVVVHSEDPFTGDHRLTTRAYVTMVAVNADGHPCPAPTLSLVSDEERDRAAAATKRRQARIARRS